MQPFTDGTCPSASVWSFRGEGLELPEVKTRLGCERPDRLSWRRQTRGGDRWAAQDGGLRPGPVTRLRVCGLLAVPGSLAQALACLSRLPGQLLSWSRLKIETGHLSTSWEVCRFFFSPLSLREPRGRCVQEPCRLLRAQCHSPAFP